MSTTLRGLQVLEALAGMRQPAKLRAVAERVDASESQTFRVLSSLVHEGYLDHVGRAGYRLGSRAVALATLMGPRPAVLRAVYPVITRLSVAVGHAVVLHLRTGASRVLILGVPSPNAPTLEPAGVPGERSPLAVGASGRVILAYVSDDDLADIDLGGLTREHLAAIRERGYEMSFGENHPGINGVSVALTAFDHLHDDAEIALGSITIAGAKSELPEQELVRLHRPLSAACRDLAPRLASLLGPNPGMTVAALDLSGA